MIINIYLYRYMWMTHLLSLSCNFPVPFACARARVRACAFTQCTFMCLSVSMIWHIDACDMIYSHAWHDWFTCMTWLIYMRDMTYLSAWRDLFTCVTDLFTWLIHLCVGRLIDLSGTANTVSNRWFRPLDSFSFAWYDS